MSKIVKRTWKKSYVRPILPKTEGSSELREIGTPLFIMTGRGCIGIDPASRYAHALRQRQNKDVLK